MNDLPTIAAQAWATVHAREEADPEQFGRDVALVARACERTLGGETGSSAMDDAAAAEKKESICLTPAQKRDCEIAAFSLVGGSYLALAATDERAVAAGLASALVAAAKQYFGALSCPAAAPWPASPAAGCAEQGLFVRSRAGSCL